MIRSDGSWFPEAMEPVRPVSHRNRLAVERQLIRKAGKAGQQEKSVCRPNVLYNQHSIVFLYDSVKRDRAQAIAIGLGEEK